MKAIDAYVNHRKMLTEELKQFVDSYSGNKKQIQALADKINHICEDKGSPVSIMPMLTSIIKDQIKKWSDKWDNKGKQLGLATKYEIENDLIQKERGIVVGHFRWDHIGYILSKQEINHITSFYFEGIELNAQLDESNEYHLAASKFLKQTETLFSLKLLKRGKYFAGDKEERNIYQITLKRGLKSYSFTFGQSINGTQKNETPNAYDVLTCLTKYDPGTHEDFCDDFGYDIDSISGLETYKAVKDEYNNLKTLYSNEELELMSEIQ
jgi:hypothetical protein